MKLHLHQILSKAGYFRDKNDLFKAINNKEIKVDGKTITDRHRRINPEKSIIEIRGKPIRIIEKHIYLLLNKPEGYLSTKLTQEEIKKHRQSIFDLINDKSINNRLKRTLFAVGRLDENTTGLMIITNDGRLSYTLTNPKYRIEKKYYALLAQPLNKEDKQKLERGVIIELEENDIVTKYKTRPCKITMISQHEVEITLTEGKKREIKRMLETINNQALTLTRTAIAGIKLEELGIKKGEHIIVDKAFIDKRILPV